MRWLFTMTTPKQMFWLTQIILKNLRVWRTNVAWCFGVGYWSSFSGLKKPACSEQIYTCSHM